MAKSPPLTQLRLSDFKGLEGPALVEKLIPALSQHLSANASAMSNGLTLSENSSARLMTVRVVAPQPAWRNVGDTGEPAFQNSWVNYDTVHFGAGFRILPEGEVQLRGLVKSGTPGATSVIFTLPSGYRPEKIVSFATDSNGAHGRLSIETDGDVIASVGNTAWFFLDVGRFQSSGSTACAPPPAFSGNGWPIVLDTGFGNNPVGVQVLQARDLSGAHALGIGGVVPDWEAASGGKVRVRRLSGLSPGRTYDVTFIMYAG